MIAVPYASELLGGALIGLAASLMLVSTGRVAGISGIFGGLLKPAAGDIGWRVAFLVGLLAAGLPLLFFVPDAIGVPQTRTLTTVGVAGLLVGLGVRMGNGCTSGHGVCGLSRLSRRSIVATASFMVAGMVTATLVQLVTGGQL